ncbi:ATP-binding protein [Desulfococcaceae bacterium HSG8]|nr:ATP-binding protein [Desulfococcaceae bacterium HSG8]
MSFYEGSNSTLWIGTYSSGLNRFKPAEKEDHPVIAELDYLRLSFEMLLVADSEISEQGRQLMEMTRNYKETVIRFLQATAEFQRQLGEVSDSKKHVMTVLRDTNEQIADTAENIQKRIDARTQMTGKIIMILSGGVFVVILLITYSVLNTFRELQRLNESLKEKNAELEHLDELKDEFLANTSHELRTPLSGIIGIAESLTDGSLGPVTGEQRHNLSLIVSSGRRLTNLVNDILDFSKLKQRDVQLRMMPMDMRSVTDLVLMLSRTLVGTREIQLVNRIGSDLPAARADEDRVQQILHNLVGNAVKFTDAGTVSVSAEVRDEYLAVTVSDTGIGIPEDSLGRIFKSFEQADGSTAREYGGTGLGLTVTRELVELHGGEIRAESEPGRGSRFTFTLPVSGDKAEPLRAAEILAGDTRVAGISAEPADIGDTGEPDIADIPPERLCDGGMCRILAVDDEPVNLQVLRNQLGSEYYSVTPASGGREALDAVESGQEFDLVLLDVMMPGMSGYEVCRHLRERYKPDELPVVMAKDRVGDLVEGFEAGANDYLTKPFMKEELIARVSSHISMKDLAAQVRDLVDNLEQKVAERTRQLEESLEELRMTQDHLVQSEKMAALGDLLNIVNWECKALLWNIQSEALELKK